VKDNVSEFPNRPFLQQLQRILCQRAEVPSERHNDRPTRLPLQPYQVARIARRCCKRLFHQDVTTALESCSRVLVVQRMRRADNDSMQVSMCQQLRIAIGSEWNVELGLDPSKLI